MKRVIAMVITLGLAFTLFVFNVSAATDMAFLGAKNAEFTNGTGTKIKIDAVELYPANDSGTIINGDYTIFHKTVIVRIVLVNMTSQTRYFYSFSPKIQFTGNTTNNGLINYVAVTDVENFSTDFMLTFNDTNSYIEYAGSTLWSFEGMPCVPPNSTLTAIAKFDFAVTWRLDTTTGSGMAWNQCRLDNISIANNTYQSPTTDFTPPGSHQDLLISLEALRNSLINQGYGLPAIDSTLEEIRDLLQDIHDSIGSSDYSDTITDSNDLQTTEDQVHQQEQQWYSDNKTAIEATGLGNYQYSPGLIDSFGVARYQIAMLWNALGDWTYVYYLVFLLGLAVYILRHEPTMRVKQMRADREARMQENQIYTNASRNVRMSRDADYARHVAWGFRSRRK